MSGLLRSRDTDLMVAGLRAMGVDISLDGTTARVRPGALRGGDIDVGLAGTVLRFLSALALLSKDPVHFDGDDDMYRRPIGTLLSAARDLGGVVDSRDDRLPFSIHGPTTASEVEIDASGSSQFVSALLLLGPHLPHGLTIRHTGGPLPSLPHIDMTLDVLKKAGAIIESPQPGLWHVTPGELNPGNLTVEPDLSNAAPFFAAAMVTGGRVSIPFWPDESTQAGHHILDIFSAMGGTIQREGSTVTVTGPDQISGIDIDMRDCGELVPTVAAVAACATSATTIRGVGHIRGHETDRLAALTAEINRLGGQVQETADGLHITPSPLHGACLRTYADHRMATCGAILGLAVEGVRLDDVSCTSKTMPTFVQLWESML